MRIRGPRPSASRARGDHLLALLALLAVLPASAPNARARLWVVHPQHPVSPALVGPDGVVSPSLHSTHASIVAAMHAATTAGDTVYVYPGAGSYNENIGQNDWRADNVVLTGPRANPPGLGGATSMVGRAEIRPTTLLGGAYYLELPPGGTHAHSGCRMEYLRLDGAAGAPAVAVRVSGAVGFTLAHCWIEGNVSNILLQGAGASNPDVRALNFTVDACSLGVSPSAPITTHPILIADGVASGASSIWGADGFVLSNNVIDLHQVLLARNNGCSILLESTLHSQVTKNTLRAARPALPGMYCGIGVYSEAIRRGITDSLEIFDNVIELSPVASQGAAIVALSVGRSLGTAAAICDGVRIIGNTLRAPAESPGTYFGIKIEADYDGQNTGDDDAYSDNIIIAGNTVENATVGIGLMENTRNGIVANNEVSFYDTTVVSHGLVLEDARDSYVVGNTVRGFQRGISLEPSNSDNPPVPRWHNSGNHVLGNSFEQCGRVVNVVRYEPPPAASWDPDDTLSIQVNLLSTWAGNQAVRCNAWAHFQTFDGSVPKSYQEAVHTAVFTYRTHAWWDQTYVIPTLGQTPAPVLRGAAIVDVAPNPFSGAVTVRLAAAEDPGLGPLSLKVYTLRGTLVRTLALGTRSGQAAGARWDGLDATGHRVASGVYILRLEGSAALDQRKVTVVR